MVRLDVWLCAFARLLPGSMAVVVAGDDVIVGMLFVVVTGLTAAVICVVLVVAIVIVSVQQFVPFVVLVNAVVVVKVVKIVVVGAPSRSIGPLSTRMVLVRSLLAPSKQMA